MCVAGAGRGQPTCEPGDRDPVCEHIHISPLSSTWIPSLRAGGAGCTSRSTLRTPSLALRGSSSAWPRRSVAHALPCVRALSVLACHGMHITSDKPISPPFPLCIYHVSSRTAASAAPALRGTSGGSHARTARCQHPSPLSMRGEPTSRQTSRSASRHASIPSIIRSGNRTAMALIAPYLRSVRAPRGHASS